jgi:hypothetical protein
MVINNLFYIQYLKLKLSSLNFEVEVIELLIDLKYLNSLKYLSHASIKKVPKNIFLNL